MKINVYVKRKVGSPSAQTTVFNTEDKNLTEELTKLRRDIIDDFSEKDGKECITVSCSLRPDFLITLDSEVSVEDADIILYHFLKRFKIEQFARIIEDYLIMLHHILSYRLI